MANTLLGRISNTRIETLLTSASLHIDLTTYLTYLDTQNGAEPNVRLDAGLEKGQLKKIQLIHANDATVNSNFIIGGARIVFVTVGDRAVLLWNGTQWRVISLNNTAGNAVSPTVTG